MFRIKICGLTRPADAEMIAACGADAVGLNFYKQSARCVDLDTARSLARLLPPQVKKVGLFVNAAPADVRQAYHDTPLDLVQLHGDEPPEYLLDLLGIPVIKAFRILPGHESDVLMYVTACRDQGAPLAGVLVDAHRPGSYGGTGQVADWNLAAALRQQLDLPLVLAGGLSPQNVADAIAAVNPAGVDTSSGVEISPGQKDAALVRDFVTHAKLQFSKAER